MEVVVEAVDKSLSKIGCRWNQFTRNDLCKNQGMTLLFCPNTHNYPLILAEGRGMGHKAGQYVKYVEEENALSNLYVRIANSMGVPIEKFGDSTGVQMTELFS
jgi:hypothetical protein